MYKTLWIPLQPYFNTLYCPKLYIEMSSDGSKQNTDHNVSI